MKNEFAAGKKSRENFSARKKIGKYFLSVKKISGKTFLEKLSSSSRYIQAPVSSVCWIHARLCLHRFGSGKWVNALIPCTQGSPSDHYMERIISWEPRFLVYR
jgi:hypothetical protein